MATCGISEGGEWFELREPNFHPQWLVALATSCSPFCVAHSSRAESESAVAPYAGPDERYHSDDR